MINNNYVMKFRQIASVIMFWKKVETLISFLFTAKRTLLMSFSPEGSGLRSRPRLRGSGPRRRRTTRPSNPSGPNGEGFDGNSQDDSFPPPGDVLTGLTSNGCSAYGFPPPGDGPVN